MQEMNSSHNLSPVDLKCGDNGVQQGVKKKKFWGAASFKFNKVLLSKLLVYHKNVIDYLKGEQSKRGSLNMPKQITVALRKFVNILYDTQAPMNPQSYSLVQLQLAQLLNRFAFDFMKQMSSKDYEQYTSISKFLQEELKQINLTNKSMSVEFLIRLDFLYLFLLQSHKLKSLMEKSQGDLYFSFASLSKMFGLDERQLSVYQKVFNLMKDSVVYEKIDEIIELAYIFFIVEIRYRIYNNYRRYGKQKVQEIQNNTQPIQINLQKDAEEQKPNIKEEQFRYRFCELFFLKSKEKIGLQKKNQLQNHLRKIQALQSFQDQKRQILRLSFRFKVSLKILADYFFSSNETYSLSLEEKQSRIVNAINKCQWYFATLEYQEIAKVLHKLSGIKIRNKHIIPLIGQNEFIWRQFYKVAMERLKLMSSVFKSQEKVEFVFENPLQIFISKSQFVYGRKEENVVTHIFGTVNNNLFFSCIAKERIDHYQYIDLLRDQFSRYQGSNLKSFNLKIYQNIYPVDKDEHLHSCTRLLLNNYFKRNFNANVFLIPPHKKLSLHFLINEAIRNILCDVIDHAKIEQIIQRVVNLANRYDIKQIVSNIERLQDYNKVEQFQEKIFEEKLREACHIINTNHYFELNNKFQQRIVIAKGNPINIKQRYSFDESQNSQSTCDDKPVSQNFENCCVGMNVERYIKTSIQNFKYRNPQLLRYDIVSLALNLRSILNERNLSMTSLRQIIRYVARNLLIYRTYFINKMSKYKRLSNYETLLPCVSDQIEYLKKVYETEERQMKKLQIKVERILTQYMSLQQYST